MKTTRLYLNYAGHCVAKESHAIRGGRNLKIKFHALWGLIEHPTEGYILFDTGYAQRFFECTKRFPNKIYAMITKVEIKPEDEIVSQLKKAGIEPLQIKKIILSHFHGDHVCGLKDFPNATIYTSKIAYDYTIKLGSFFAFSKGVLKKLLPADIDKRVVFIENSKQVPDEIFEKKYDLFGDESVYVYELPGHARGQVGIQVKTEKQNYFLIADACWMKKSFEESVLPKSMVRLFFDSWGDFKQSLDKVHRYHKANPHVMIVPTHCSETTDKLVNTHFSLGQL